MWNGSYRTPTERWQKTSDFPKVQPFTPLLCGKLHKGFGKVRFLMCELLIFDSELYAGNEVIHNSLFTISKED